MAVVSFILELRRRLGTLPLSCKASALQGVLSGPAPHPALDAEGGTRHPFPSVDGFGWREVVERSLPQVLCAYTEILPALRRQTPDRSGNVSTLIYTSQQLAFRSETQSEALSMNVFIVLVLSFENEAESTQHFARVPVTQAGAPVRG